MFINVLIESTCHGILLATFVTVEMCSVSGWEQIPAGRMEHLTFNLISGVYMNAWKACLKSYYTKCFFPVNTELRNFSASVAKAVFDSKISR